MKAIVAPFQSENNKHLYNYSRCQSYLIYSIEHQGGTCNRPLGSNNLAYARRLVGISKIVKYDGTRVFREE